ncbi:CTLH/CRA C-terminal to lish motif domain-containing protein [Cladochytrium replicatum]|nr:CTLH/CRA C-terminal to lish motif domain-containing protein [Cladochytrium replicatum]
MDTVLKEYEKVAKRQKLTADSTADAIDTLIAELSNVRNEIQTAAANSDLPMQDAVQSPEGKTSRLSAARNIIAQSSLSNRVKALASQASEAHKELTSTVAKYAKVLDKKFKNVDLDTVWDPHALDNKERVLNNTILQHFIREGRFEFVDMFAREAGITAAAAMEGEPADESVNMDLEASEYGPFEMILSGDATEKEKKVLKHMSVDEIQAMKEKFTEMYRILGEMRQKNLSPALIWCQQNRGNLDSSLEFTLDKQQFIQLLQEDRSMALNYAKQKFPYFAKSNLKEIQRMMCSFLYVRNLDKSPYADFLSPSALADLERKFTSEYCTLLGLPTESPLYASVTIGTAALPTIIKMSSIMKDKSGLEWTQAGELPVEIPLHPRYRFHSVFACPVSKEMATEENPPMMMECGHVICKESLNRLCKNNTATRFKCPYCPQESIASAAIRVYF